MLSIESKVNKRKLAAFAEVFESSGGRTALFSICMLYLKLNEVILARRVMFHLFISHVFMLISTKLNNEK